jgi:hypothetical protein
MPLPCANIVVAMAEHLATVSSLQPVPFPVMVDWPRRIIAARSLVDEVAALVWLCSKKLHAKAAFFWKRIQSDWQLITW